VTRPHNTCIVLLKLRQVTFLPTTASDAIQHRTACPLLAQPGFYSLRTESKRPIHNSVQALIWKPATHCPQAYSSMRRNKYVTFASILLSDRFRGDASLWMFSVWRHSSVHIYMSSSSPCSHIELSLYSKVATISLCQRNWRPLFEIKWKNKIITNTIVHFHSLPSIMIVWRIWSVCSIVKTHEGP
jgi:hypothetical protein